MMRMPPTRSWSRTFISRAPTCCRPNINTSGLPIFVSLLDYLSAASFTLFSTFFNMLKKILIANRGEIAIRIMRACKELGIQTVAIYSDADKNALHVQQAEEAIRLGTAASKDSYLNGEKIIAAARQANADAIH